MYIIELPYLVLLRIFSFVLIEDLITLYNLCQTFQSVIDSPLLWKSTDLLLQCDYPSQDVFDFVFNYASYIQTFSCGGELYLSDFEAKLGLLINSNTLFFNRNTCFTNISCLNCLPHLKTLCLSGCYNISKSSFLLFKNGTVKTLDISLCDQLESKDLFVILDNNPQIEDLNIELSFTCSLQDICKLCSMLPCLTTLNATPQFLRRGEFTLWKKFFSTSQVTFCGSIGVFKHIFTKVIFF